VPLTLVSARVGLYLRDIFYIKTFNVAEYIRDLKAKNANCLVTGLVRKYAESVVVNWRVYETRFKRSDFGKRFGKKFDETFEVH